MMMTTFTKEAVKQLAEKEVKNITSKIFNDISKIVNKYDGFIEKF